VLVHAASGGVGLAALQVARRAGARVLATAGNAQKRAYLRGLGLDCVGDSRSLAFADEVRAATGGAGVDVVLNCLAGAMTDASLDLVRPGGLFLELGKTDIRAEDDIARRHPGIRYRVFDLLAEIDRTPDRVGRSLVALLSRFATGELQALPVRGFPFAEAADGLRFLARARHIGKVVLTDTPVPVPRPDMPLPEAAPPADMPRPAIAEDAIAIIGMAGRFPGAPDLDAFWRLLRAGGEAIGPVPEGRWSRQDFAAAGAPDGGAPRHRLGGFLADAESFDAAFFGISPREALLMDPQQRLLLEQAWLALTDAGLPAIGADGLRVGVYIGASASDYTQKAAALGMPADRPSLLAQMPSSLAARLGYVFDLKGPSLTVDTGCASAVAALKLAVDALRRGEVDVALAGAVAVQSTPHLALMADQAEILAPDGRCRAFAATAQGLGLSEGVAVVVLRRLTEAEAAGDAVHAVIRAVALSQNGATNGMSAPSVTAQIALARGALAEAGIAPESVSYVEGHGVGTRAGDAAEVAALAEIFGSARTLPLGSVKRNIGHALAAAGMAGLLKTVLQLRHQEIAPAPHAASALLPELADSGLALPTQPIAWVAADTAPRRAAINAFAINGANGFILVEAPPLRAPRPVGPASAPALILLAAGSEAALRARLGAVADWLAERTVDLADLALGLNRAAANANTSGPVYRAAFVAASVAELHRQLTAAAAAGGFTPVQRRDAATRPIFAGLAERLCQEAEGAPAADRAAKLAAAGQLFVDGADVAPPALPGARCIGGLPGHRFERQRFWLGDAPAAATPEPDAAPLRVPEDHRLTTMREAAAAVLQLPVSAVPGEAVLARLGLDSLLALDLRGRLARALDAAVDPATLLSGATLAEIAAALPAVAPGSSPAPLPALRRDEARRFEPFPLTDIQLAYWLGRRPDFALGGACHVYWEFLGPPDRDPDRLESALNRLIGLHDMLRAVVGADGLQRVLPTVPPYVIARHDWRAMPPGLAALREEMAQEIFDPAQWPLFRIAFSRDACCTRLHLSIDLLIIDVPSLALLLDQWARLEREPALVLAPPGLAFRDYVLHQKAQEQGALHEAARSYWRDRLAQLPPAPRLPGMKPFDARRAWPWRRHRGGLARSAWTAFQARARAAGATPVAALVTAFAETLAHWAEDRRFTLNLTVNDREPVHPDVAGVIGDFTSTLLLGLDLAAAQAFADRARETGGQVARHLAHARFPGVKVLQARSGAGAAALMPVVFTSMLGYGALSGPFGRIDFGVTQTPQVWLDVQVMEEDGGLVATWDVIDGLFPDGLLGGIFAVWMAALQALADTPARWETPLGSWLTETEHARRARRNATDHPIVEGLLHEPFLRQALAAPERVALVTAESSVTYGALLGQALAVAEALGPVPPDELVAVAMPKGALQIAAVIGVLLAGGAYLPIDSALPSARQRHLLTRGAARVVLTLAALDPAWPDTVRVIAVDRLAPAPLPAAQPPRRAAPGDLAYVIFTSGSTGEPKGVMIEHRAALNTVFDVNERFAVGPADRVLGLSALSFDLSVYDIFGLLGAGGAVVLPDARSASDPAHLAERVLRHGVTLWNSVPMFVQLFLAGDRAAEALARLRLVMMSGDWIPLGLPIRLSQASPDLAIVSLGGATEAAIWSIAYPVGAPDPAWTSIPYGYPMRNQRFHVLDETMADCPDWVAGELYIAGTGLARGYWRDPATTAARFVIHPVTGERLYRTGDLGRYREDGVIEFLGRIDGQVKLGGYRIELGEVETALGRHPGVRQAAVVMRKDAEGHDALAAFYVSDADPPPDAAALRAHLGGMLPPYMVPASFRRLDVLPLNANEKVDRKALAAGWGEATAPTPRPVALAPAPPPDAAAPDAAALESRILAIWREVLGDPLLPADGKLFENGAHSFHAVDANTRINRALRLGCTVTDIFECATVRDLAATLAARRGATAATAATAAPPPAEAPPRIVARGDRRRQFRAMTVA
jgi:amino acid adenylation domain-containing protein